MDFHAQRSAHAPNLEPSDVIRVGLDLVLVSVVQGGAAISAKTAIPVSSPIVAPPYLAPGQQNTPAMTMATVPACRMSSMVSVIASLTTVLRTALRCAPTSAVTTVPAPKAAQAQATAHATPASHSLTVLTVLPATMAPPAVISAPEAC